MKSRYLMYCVFLLYITLGTVYGQEKMLVNYHYNHYRANDKLKKVQVEYKDPGMTGENRFWDFSALQIKDDSYLVNYTLKSISDTSLIVVSEHNTRYYFRQQYDSLFAIGFENGTTYMEYTKPELKLRFPFHYGDSLYSKFEGKGQYCHQQSLQVKGDTRIYVDAIGQILLPNETIKQALRIHTQKYYHETGKDSVKMVIDTYTWYANGFRYPVFESIKSTMHITSGVESTISKDTIVHSASFYYPPTVQKKQIEIDSIPTILNGGSEVITTVFTEARYMPNPVVSNLNIDYKLTRPAKVWFTIHDNLGVLQCSTKSVEELEGYHNITIPMNGLITGSYSLYVHIDDMTIKKLVIKN